MKKRKFILGGITGLLFMAFVAINVMVRQSYQGDTGISQITIMGLIAKAGGGDESGWDGEGHGTLVEGQTSGNRYCCPGSNDCAAIKMPDVRNCP